mmetsp:Transcript_61064/g.132376  ORF Transcript_61064/g.132376 Transcript_61064/m.132376 type:complete len:242 (+) Transcript_61064:69-794(+)
MADQDDPADAAQPPEEPRDGSGKPTSHLVLFNVGKRQNWGTLLRSACAFGVTEVCVVGSKKLATFGSQGTAANAPIRHFESLTDVKAEMSSRGIRLCGVEIDPEAVGVHTQPFQGSTAFMLGNEGQGMTPAQRAVCDFFVYIPQHSGATASLNVAIAGSIVLHHFAIWAKLEEHPRVEGKYVVEVRNSLDRYLNPTDLQRLEVERKRAARASKRRHEDSGSLGDVEEAALGELDDFRTEED